jgi:hypothetical protein
MLASIRLHLAQGIKAFDQGSYKKTRTSTYDHGGMTSPQGLKQGQGFAFKAPGAQMLGYRTIAYKKMGNSLLFSDCRSRRPHGHFTVTLPGIGRDDRGLKLLGQLNSQGRFAGGGWADHQQ